MPKPTAAATFTEIELDVMDELYFIKPYSQLAQEVDLGAEELNQALWSLIQKGFVRTASLQDGQPHQLPTNEAELMACNLLATKEGLLALHSA